MSRFQLASDLHIETIPDNQVDPLYFIEPKAKYLILAGDIGSFYRLHQLQNFFDKLVPHFERIFYLPGNSEFYLRESWSYQLQPRPFDQLLNDARDLLKKYKNVEFLNQSTVEIEEDIVLISATLWTYTDSFIPRFIVKIHEATTEWYRNKHLCDKEYILDRINWYKENKPDLKCLVVTHHPPTFLVVREQKKRRKFDFLYGNNMDDYLDAKIVHSWIYGHVHNNIDYYSEKGCRVFGNQYGKEKEESRSTFKKDFVFDCI